MRVKVDEDLPAATAALLRNHGYDAETVLDEGMGGSKDQAIWQAAQSEQRLLVTADKGFGDLRSYPPGGHHGVLLLRPDADGIAPLLELLGCVLENHGLALFAGALVVATPRGVRIRRSL